MKILFTISLIILTSFLILFAIVACTGKFDDIHRVTSNAEKSNRYDCALTLAHKSADLDDKADSLAELAGLYMS